MRHYRAGSRMKPLLNVTSSGKERGSHRTRRCRLTQPEEPPCGRPDVHATIILGSSSGAELAHEAFDCWDVAPVAGSGGARGGETEAALTCA